MPIYEYRCGNGHVFEVMQRMDDAPVVSCTTCSESVERVFRPVAVHFKGSGFYTTDYGRYRSGGGDSAGAASDDSRKDSKDAASRESSAKSDSDSGKSDSSKPDSKSDSAKSGSS